MRFSIIMAVAAVLPLGGALADPAGPADKAGGSAAEIAQLRARGQQVWTETCAACHEATETRAPRKYYLTQTRSPDYVYRALTAGVMKDVTASVSLADKKAVVTYLLGSPPGGASEIDPNANRCKAAAPPMTLAGSTWNGWGGAGVTNARYQANPGFTTAQLPRLKMKWAFAFPGGVSNEPSVAGGRLFVSSMSGIVYSLDARTGCTYWSKDLGVSMRTMIPLGKLPSGRIAAYLTDWHGKVLAVDAATGKEIWSTIVEDHRAVRLTGSPTLYAGRLYVPVSSGEEGLAGDPQYQCCTMRGSLVALDALTGKRFWKSYTIDQAPAPLPGGHRMGPAGASIWTSPTIDQRRKLIYIGTGNDVSEPASKVSDAVIAFDLATGAKRWVRQVHPNDVYMNGCTAESRTINCPTVPVGPDFDFGASPVLIPGPGGKDIVVAVNKAGVAFGINPDNGKLVWETKLGRGGLIGGLEWGVAYDGKLFYAPMSDAPFFGHEATGDPAHPGFPVKPGLNAVDPFTGKLAWFTPAPVVPCSWKEGICAQSFAGAAAAIPGAVFAGAWDGHIRAFSAADGAILWDYDTGRTFSTVNGSTATGGAVNHGAQTVAAGMVFVTSGGRQGQPGNLMLAFSIDGK